MEQDTLNKITGGSFLTTPINESTIFSREDFTDEHKEIESMVKKFVIGKEYEGVFLKPKYGDASGVRGAARLGREAVY